MTKNLLIPEDQATINEFTQKFEPGLEAIEKAKQAKIGDYLVLYLDNHIGEMLGIA